MNNLHRVKLGSFFTQSIAGEWGSEPAGIDDVIVYRAADFSKDCKLNVTEGALRSVPKSKLRNRKLNRNDILVEKSGGSPTQPVGRAVIYKPESDEQVATCSNFLQRLVVDEEYSPEFVYYLMLGLYQANATLPYQQQTTGIYNLKLEEYLQTEVDTYVDRNLQEKVADILSTIDNQIDSTQALIDKYTAIKQGMMADLFSRGIDPETKALRPTFEEAPELYHKTPLGMLPKEWDAYDIEDISDVIDPNPSHRNPIYRADGFAFISTVEFIEGDSVKTNTSRRVAESIVLEQERRCAFNENSIVFSRKGTIGETRFVPTSCRFALLDSLCVLNPKNVDVTYFYHSLRSPSLKTQINQMVMGQALPQVSIGRVRELLIPMPNDATEQRLIGQRIGGIAELLNSELLHLRKLQAQKAGLMQDLLTGKVHVPV
ncbi:restriction endonuclease subunit S [Pseudoalteromonas lipolytica]|uniref:restriction endonuclease subunit S n=1 Tax=Pseudoalteromonas lipolytica TaxID=570156 RepID=UPI003B9DD59A